MDITGWGWGKILQLPKHAFGRRFVVSCTLVVTQDEYIADISEVPFPERTVLWSLSLQHTRMSSVGDEVHIALGDQVPADINELWELDPLIMGLGGQGREPRAIAMRDVGALVLRDLKMGIDTAGRRLVLAGEYAGTDTVSVICAVTCSGVPREVPDWMVSGLDRNR